VDLDYHVRRIRLPRPGTAAQLEDCAGRLHAELLDRSRPLWQLVVIDGLQSGQAAYYFKVHHAVVDGQSGVMLAQTLFDLTPKPRRILPGAAAPAEHPGKAALAAAALKHDVGQYIKLIRHLPEVVKTLSGLFGAMPDGAKGRLSQNAAFGPKTALNLPVSGARGFAGASIALHTLKALAAAHEAKLNDVVMALCSGMLRRYLAQHGGIPKKPLIAAMPISVRQAGNTEYTTQATMAVVNLNTHIADPVKRLRAIRDAAGAVKAVAQRAKGLMPTDFPTIGVPWVMHGLATMYGRSGIAKALPPLANVVISNVPGPQVPLYAAGARMLHYWPMSIVEHGLGLNITVLSYAGSMDFGFTTALNVVADARELSAALMQALDELVAATQPPERRKPVLRAAALPTLPKAAAKGVDKTSARKRSAARRPAV
ncbi:MAG TPA: wax ester/triacylglycerol synthase family O-acyltransferase, partial [Rubrivivax sp.]|nr:wax ester/triacylglycerol synthase family O-acyltransferase [Rubrivivax sp.]